MAASTSLADTGTWRSVRSEAIIRTRRGKSSTRLFTPLSLEPLHQDLGDVARLDPVANLLGLHPVLEHREAEGAGGGEDVRIHLHRLFDTHLVHAPPLVLFHQHPAPAA